MTEQERDIASTTKDYQRSWNRWCQEYPDAPPASPEQLARLLQSSSEHNECRAWNQWRNEHPEIAINLRGTDLSGVDLTGANLSDAALMGVRLIDVKLDGTDLRGAYLAIALIDAAAVWSHPFLINTITSVWLASGKQLPVRLAPRIIFGN